MGLVKALPGLVLLIIKRLGYFSSVKDEATKWCKASLTDEKYPSQKSEQED